jgi:uncharacterized protein (UPF0254 family)/uncharacterized membrane protein
MFSPIASVFTGNNRTRVFRDCIVDEDFFFVFEAEEGMSKADGHSFMKKVVELKSHKRHFENLNDLEIWLNEAVLTANIPAHFSVSAGVFHKNVLYIKTVGKGEVHMRRGKDFARLIHGDKSASGYIEEGDMIVFTTADFREIIETEEKLKKTLDNDTPEDITQNLEEYFKEKEDRGSLALFLEVALSEDTEEDLPLGFAAGTAEHDPELKDEELRPDASEMEDDDTYPDDEADDDSPKHRPNYHSRAVMNTEVEEEPFPRRVAHNKPDYDEADDYVDGIGVAGAGVAGMGAGAGGAGAVKVAGAGNKGVSLFAGIKNRVAAFSKSGGGKSLSKKITLVAVVVIFAIFIWTIVFGYQRRQKAEDAKKIAAAEQIIDEKTQQADEISFLNMDRALALLNEARAELTTVKEEVGKGNEAELARLEKKIIDVENAIVQKDEQEPEEFYDLALEAEDAKGDGIFLDGDKLAILDRSSKTVYNFSIEDKSLEKSTNAAVGNATFVGMSKGTIYVLDPAKGLYEFTDDTKAELVIEKDEDWGTIRGMAFFNGNVYLLDSKNGDVYKYLVVEGGFSDPSSYFTGTKPETVKNATSIAIDASIYLSQDDSILKFTRGEADAFNTVFPSDDVSIEKLYTDEETEKVYAWDKSNATLYILSKNGAYERQIKASVLAKASDFVVYQNQILVLSGSKIYTLTEGDAEPAE